MLSKSNIFLGLVYNSLLKLCLGVYHITLDLWLEILKINGYSGPALGSNVQCVFVCSFLNKIRDMIHGWILCMFKPNIIIAFVGLKIILYIMYLYHLIKVYTFRFSIIVFTYLRCVYHCFQDVALFRKSLQLLKLIISDCEKNATGWNQHISSY